MKKYLPIILFAWLAFFCVQSKAQGSWTQKSSIPTDTGICSPASFVIGSKAYIITGTDGSNRYFNEVWEYNSINDTWTKKSNFPGAGRFAASGFAIGNKGYICGGSSAAVTIGYADLWEYDPNTDSWTSKAPCPGGARDMAVAFSIGNKGYIGTGRPVGSSATGVDFWEYDPMSNTWAQKANVPGFYRIDAIAFVINNKGYVGFGNSYGHPNQSDLYEFDPQSNTWTAKSSGGLIFLAAAYFTIGNTGYVVSGDTELIQSHLVRVMKYDALTDSWSKETSFPAAGRIFANGFSIGGKGYVGLGNIGEFSWTLPNDLYAFTPPETLTTHPFEVPNVFTPNGDGINDLFQIPGEGLASFQCEIFNRWGVEVAQVSDDNPTWDGKNYSEGVYFYTLRGKFFKDEKPLNMKGNLTLIR